ncbi:MAG: hypothetical protein LBD47_02965 [Treponema sp.]|jgi:hypothetical protein|nr:hypothetical protein [Treponema sp.]
METIKAIPPEVAAIIPLGQYAVTEEHLDTFAEAVERLTAQVRKCPHIGGTDGMKEHPATFHYFYSGTDMYICEYDREHGIMFGFFILNGDLHNAEWGYIDLAQILTIPVMNIDYHFEEQSVEAALYKKYPRHFSKPASLERS